MSEGYLNLMDKFIAALIEEQLRTIKLRTID